MRRFGRHNELITPDNMDKAVSYLTPKGLFGSLVPLPKSDA